MVLEWLPLVASVLALFVRTMQAVYTFTLPDHGWLDIVYSVAAFLTLALYPAILSLTPVQTSPARFLDVANNTRLLAAFREWADMQFSPLYVALVQRLCVFKLRSLDLRARPGGQNPTLVAQQRAVAREILSLGRRLMLQGVCAQIDKDLAGCQGALPAGAFAELQKVALLDLDSAVIRFSSSPQCMECLREGSGTVRTTLLDLFGPEARLSRRLLRPRFIADQ